MRLTDFLNAAYTDETSDLLAEPVPEPGDYVYDGNDVFVDGKQVITWNPETQEYVILAIEESYPAVEDAIWDCIMRSGNRTAKVWRQTDDGDLVQMDMNDTFHKWGDTLASEKHTLARLCPACFGSGLTDDESEDCSICDGTGLH
jgi:hypothetical protein